MLTKKGLLLLAVCGLCSLSAGAQQNPELVRSAAGVAMLLRMDTLPVFRQAMEECRCRLAAAYMTGVEAKTDGACKALQTDGRAERVRVCHIFKRLSQHIPASGLRQVEARMDSISRALEAGASFEQCVQRFSDEKESFWITRLQVTEELEKMAFGLASGTVSKPFFTPEGIHILKVLERQEASSSGETPDGLPCRQRVCPTRLDEIPEAWLEQLKVACGYCPDEAALNELKRTGHASRPLFTLDGKAYTEADFARFAVSRPASVGRQLKEFIAKSVLDYEYYRLEQRHPDFGQQMQTCRDSLLYEALYAREVGNPDSWSEAELERYFEAHRSDYHWPEPRYRGMVLHCVTKQVAKRARKFLKQLPEEEWNDAIRLTFNAGTEPQIKVEQGTFAPGEHPDIDRLVFKKRVEETSDVSFPFTALAGRKLKGPERWQEVAAPLLQAYRSYREQRWEARLRLLGKVEINQEVLKTVNNDGCKQ